MRQDWLDRFHAGPSHALRPDLAVALDDFLTRRMARALEIRGVRQTFTPVTIALITINLFAFVADLITGNPENPETLVQLGGMWPPYVMAGQWWRLGAALFLHAGLAHFIFNMLMLFELGRVYERRNGSRPMLALYGLGGLISMASVLTLMWQEFVPFGVLVGASGAIFALFGGEIVDIMRRWRTTSMKEDRNEMFLIALFLILQVAFDHLAPAISFSAHVSGFVAGLVIGVILNLVRR